MKRLRGDDGVFAILYALLVLLVLAMASIVVDLGLLRADKRESRSAADAAALAGSVELGAGPWNPLKACQVAWAYALDNLSLADAGTSPCGSAVPGPGFADNTLTCPSATSVASGVVEGVTISILWPIPSTSTMLTEPDGEPASVARAYEPDSDGSVPGCDRLGVTISRQRNLGVAAAAGTSTGSSNARSVARFDPEGGPSEEVAALNVLNRRDCQTLVTTGGGRVLVAPTVRNNVVVGPGIIAVESGGTTGCNGGDRVIAPAANAITRICASNVALNALGTNCDGLGLIRSHALDPGQVAARAFSEAAVANGNLRPQPSPENGRKGWDPVTTKYGCEVLTASLTAGGCVVGGPRNHIRQLVNALGGPGLPTKYLSVAPYNDPSPAAFTAVPAACPGGAGITTTVTLLPGSWYADCTIKIGNGGQLIVQGGTLVVQGGISVSSGGCLVMNHTTCTPALTGQGTSAVSTNPAPARDALVFLRGTTGCPSAGCLDVAGTFIAPRTFFYSAAGADGINVSSTSLTLWTAPGAGPVDASDRTALENQCLATTPAGLAPSEDCMNARFARLNYWSEFPSPKTKPNNFAGQGALNVVGVFFTPRAYFDFSGGGNYVAASAQFWADSLNVTGDAFLGLRPDARSAIATPSARVQLIR